MEFAGIVAQNRPPLCSNSFLFGQKSTNNATHIIRYFVTGQISINITPQTRLKTLDWAYTPINKPISHPYPTIIPMRSCQTLLQWQKYTYSI